jgi:hypothetical protein
MNVFLPDIHRAAHHDQQIIRQQIRNPVTFVEFDLLQRMAALRPQLPEYSRMLDGDVLKNQNAHDCCHLPARMVDRWSVVERRSVAEFLALIVSIILILTSGPAG